MDFDLEGKLPAGIHDYTMVEFIQRFVEQFPTSQSRTRILESLVLFFRELLQTGTPHEIWIDGSYATSKVNPNDADVVVFLHHSQAIVLQPQCTLLRKKYYPTLDLYFAVAVSDETQKATSANDFLKIQNNRNYWRGQFGFDREDKPKGIIRLFPESVKEYIDRR